MRLEVRLFAQLREALPKEDRGVVKLDLPSGSTANDLINHLALSRKYPLIIFQNGKRVAEETVLQDGDRVGIFPPVGGG